MAVLDDDGFHKPFFLNPGEIERIGNVIGGSLGNLLANELVNKASGTLVIIDGTQGWRRPESSRLGMTIEEIVNDSELWECKISPNVMLERVYADGQRYQRIARAKALLSLRTQMTTRGVVESAPHLLLPGDIQYAGGVYRQGIAVGFSGVEQDMDHAIAMFVLELLFGRMRMAARAVVADGERKAFL